MSRLLRLCFLTLLLAPLVCAQFGSGIQGTVLDSTSAVVPGVEVVVTNTGTGVSREAVTSAVGVYRVLNLSPGTYSIRAAKEGFIAAQRESVVLTVDETRRVDFTLAVGSVVETISVTAAAAALETEEGRISGQIDTKELEELPIPNRNVFNLLSLQPGVTGRSLGTDNVGGSSTPQVHASGMRTDSNSTTIDDTNANSISRGGRSEVTPNVETVAEVRVVTNNFSAEQGRNMGAQVSVVTKSGTNEFHGTLWNFHRNNKFNSREFFDPVVPVYRRNQFGYGIGGPIVKNRTFFYTTFEGLRHTGSSSDTVSIETPQLRDYVLATRPNSIAAHIFDNFRPVADPTFNLVDRGTPLPGVNEWSSTPDGIPDTGTLRYARNSDSRSNQFTARVDHEISPGKDRFYAYFYRHDGRTINTPARTEMLGGYTVNAGTFGNVNYTRIISPTTVNELRAGVTRWIGNYCTPLDPQNGPLGEKTCPDIPHKEVPEIVITGMDRIRDGHWSGYPAGWFPTEYQLKDTLSTIRGNHALKVGGELRYAKNILYHTRYLVPYYSFTSVLDFIDDEPQEMRRTVDPRNGQPIDTRNEQRIWEGALFIQDDWKVRRDLTINIGLRYDYFGPYTDPQGILRNLVPGSGTGFETIANAKVDVVDKAWNTDTLNLAPRFGFAWDIGAQGKNVIRGGFGMSYDRMATVYTAAYRENPPIAATAVLGQQVGSEFTYSLGDVSPGIPYGVSYPVDPALQVGLDERNGIRGSRIDVRVINNEFNNPYAYNWFFSTQRLLPGQMVVEASYIGSSGHHLVNISNINRYSGDLLDGRFDGFNPSFRQINMAQTASGSIYHGGTLAVRRQFSRGVSFQGSYTIGKVITDAEAEQGATSYYDAHNRAMDRAVASFDVPQRVAFMGVWEIPFLRTCPSLACKIAGGWQLSGYGVFEQGLPMNVTTSRSYPRGDFNADGTNADRPNAPAESLARSGFTQQQFIDGIFTAADFPLPASGTFGNLGRNAFRAPGFARVDLSLMKNFAVNERVNLQVRLESFNAFNRVNLDAPSTDMV